MRCHTCRDTDYITAPPTNAWTVYFKKRGLAYHVKVPCPACGGVSGKANRKRMRERLEARKKSQQVVCG